MDLDRRTDVHCTAGLGRAPLTVLGYLVCGRLSARGCDPADFTRPSRCVPAWAAFHGAADDMEKRYREEIEKLAYKLPQAGINADPRADWDPARARIFRHKLSTRTWAR